MNIIRKKSSFLRDDSYRIFHIVENEQISINHQSMKILHRNELIDIQPKLHFNSHRRQIACGIVLLALTIIIIIILYVIIMTVKYINESPSWTYSNRWININYLFSFFRLMKFRNWEKALWVESKFLLCSFGIQFHGEDVAFVDEHVRVVPMWIMRKRIVDDEYHVE